MAELNLIISLVFYGLAIMGMSNREVFPTYRKWHAVVFIGLTVLWIWSWVSR